MRQLLVFQTELHAEVLEVYRQQTIIHVVCPWRICENAEHVC